MVFHRNTLLELLDGVHTFESEVYPQKQELFQSLAYDQTPPTLFITCADSRISPSLITQTEPGELFLIRNVGNIVPAYGNMVGAVASAIEYAVGALKVKNIIVCGHSNCGAMSALINLAIDPDKLNHMPTVRRWLHNAEAAAATISDLRAEDVGPKDVRDLAEANVRLQITHLKTHPIVAKALSRGELNVQGWYYDIKKGRVYILTEDAKAEHSVKEAISILRKNKDPNNA